jgi:UDP-glucose 4-epimerase
MHINSSKVLEKWWEMGGILVTGGAGFIGSHLVDLLLQEGFEIFVIDNLSSGKLINLPRHPNLCFYQVDILHEEFYKVVERVRPDAIIHLAAQSSVRTSIQDMLIDEQINIRGSLQVIEAANRYGVKRILFSSTAAVYGDPVVLPISLDHPIEPLSPYGISKYAVEKYLAYAKRSLGLDVTVLRLANVYGPRQNTEGEGGVIATFIGRFFRNEVPAIYGTGQQTRDFIYVLDVANVFLQALVHGGSGVFHVSTGQAISINRLYQVITDQLPQFPPPRYEKSKEGEIEHSYLSNQRTIEKFSWDPQVSLEKGIQSTIDYYRNACQVSHE